MRERMDQEFAEGRREVTVDGYLAKDGEATRRMVPSTPTRNLITLADGRKVFAGSSADTADPAKCEADPFHDVLRSRWSRASLPPTVAQQQTGKFGPVGPETCHATQGQGSRGTDAEDGGWQAGFLRRLDSRQISSRWDSLPYSRGPTRCTKNAARI